MSYSGTLESGFNQAVNLGANQVLTVVGGVGTVRGLDTPLLWTITAGSTTAIGPYTSERMLKITCTTGPITYTVAPVDLGIIPNVTTTAAEININDGEPASISFSAAAGASTISNVTITVKDAAGVAIANAFRFDVWLSDAATGAGITGTAASGTVTAKSASGSVVTIYTAKKDIRVQALATGVFILEITDAAKTGFYVCASLPSTGATQVSAQLVSGDYGA